MLLKDQTFFLTPYMFIYHCSISLHFCHYYYLVSVLSHLPPLPLPQPVTAHSCPFLSTDLLEVSNVRRKFFLPTVDNCLPMEGGGPFIVGVFS